jgi:hypothetical protein
MEKEVTLGEKRVKAEFNPAKNDLVDQIKNQTAVLINMLEDMRNLPLTGGKEKQRLISLAQTAYEEAAMWAVKANFTE